MLVSEFYKANFCKSVSFRLKCKRGKYLDFETNHLGYKETLSIKSFSPSKYTYGSFYTVYYSMLEPSKISLKDLRYNFVVVFSALFYIIWGFVC